MPRPTPAVSPAPLARPLDPKTHQTHQSTLKQTGLKVTEPRIKILKLFERPLMDSQGGEPPTTSARHLSAEDVYRLLLGEQQDVGLATVYRVLGQFEQAGILTRHHFTGAEGAGKALYELADSAHHDHLVCLDCGRVEEFFDVQIEERQRRVAKRMGFALADHALSLYAHCAKRDCAHAPGGGATALIVPVAPVAKAGPQAAG